MSGSGRLDPEPAFLRTDAASAGPAGVSVVIPAYNEEHYLPATLDRLRVALDLYSRRYKLPHEVIVADNGSTDRTVEVARSLGARVVHEPTRTIAAVRNAGARASRGSLLVFVDADMLVSPDMVLAAADDMARGAIGGAVARVYPDRPIFLAALYQGILNTVARYERPGGSVLYAAREAFAELGGFDERYMAFEDVLFVRRLSRIARRRRASFSHTRSAYVIQSARKFEQHSTSTLLWTAFKFILFPWWFRSRKACSFWYDIGERPAVGLGPPTGDGARASREPAPG